MQKPDLAELLARVLALALLAAKGLYSPRALRSSTHHSSRKRSSVMWKPDIAEWLARALALVLLVAVAWFFFDTTQIVIER